MALKKVDVVIVGVGWVGGIIAQLTPVTSMVLGWMLFRDRLGGLALAGAGLTLAGVSVGAYLASGREADPVEE